MSGRLIPTVLGGFIAVMLPAQAIYQIGYRWEAFNLAELNATFEAYNAQRPWLQEQLRPMDMPGSLAITVGERFKGTRTSVLVHVQGFRRETYAQGLEPATGLVGHRRIAFHHWSVGTSANVLLWGRRHIEVQVEPIVEYSITGLSTYYAQQRETEPDDQEVLDQRFSITLGIGPRLDLYATRWLGISLRASRLFSRQELEFNDWAAFAASDAAATGTLPIGRNAFSCMLIIMPNRKPHRR